MQLLKSVLKSLLFAMLLSGAASEKPRLRGTSSERAAVSNQFNPGPRIRDRERHEPSSFVPAASRAMNQNPDPDSNDPRMPSPQVVLIDNTPHANNQKRVRFERQMPLQVYLAVYAIWQTLLLANYPWGAKILRAIWARWPLQRLIRPVPVAPTRHAAEGAVKEARISGMAQSYFMGHDAFARRSTSHNMS